MTHLYNITSLQELCKKQNIDFSKIKKIDKFNKELDDNEISSKIYIEGSCTSTDCRGIFHRRISEIDKYGGKCERCVKNRTNKHTLETLESFELTLSKKYYRDELHAHCIIEGNCKNKNCMNIFSKKFCQLIKLGGYCNKCSIKNGNEKKIITVKEKYNVENVSQSEKIKKQKIETCTENYGVSYPTQSNIIQKQIIETSNKNWGTNRPTQNKELLERIHDDYEKTSGYRTPVSDPKIREKGKNTYEEKTGFRNPFSNPIIKEKIEQTNLLKHGYTNPMKNPKIMKKAFKSGFKMKPYELPSGKIIEYMGWENYALDELLTMYDENDIENENLQVFDYIKPDGTTHTYHPDIYIKSINKFIEVKSTYTITQSTDIIFLKQQSVKDSGNDCEIWVYNSQGKKVDCYI
jgi:hypothetical protein